MQYANTAEAPRQPGQIPTQLSSLDAEIAAVEKCFASLVQRTEWVQRAIPTNPEKDGTKEVEATMCEVAMQINRACKRLRGLAENMTGLLSRIEL